MSLDVLDVDFSGTADAGGNVTILLNLNRTYWASARVVASTTGNAQWAVLVNARPVTFGRGARCDVGPVMLSPTDQITINVTNASAGAQVAGKIVGVTASTLQEALQQFRPAPNTIALDTASPGQVLVAQKTIVPGSQFVTGIQLQPGFHGLGFLTSSAGVGTCQIQGITGEQTNASYLGRWIYAVEGFTVIPLLGPNPLLDTSVQLTVNNSGIANFQLWVFGIFDVEQLPPENRTNLPIPPVAAAWQAAQSLARINVNVAGGGGTATIVAANTNLRTYMHSYSLGQDGANPVGLIGFQDTAGNPIADFAANGTRQQNATGSFSGFPTPAGTGVRVTNGGGAASFLVGYLTYTQAV